ALERGEPLRRGREPLDSHDPATAVVRQMNLLTAKPQLFLLNGAPEDVPRELITLIERTGAGYVVADLACVKAIPDLIRKAYEVLSLISFFTTGEDETRAWTIQAGAKAPQAAGTIHTDFETKFIRAEVVSYDDLVTAGGWVQAKQKGKLRLEGREYIVQDGDVIVVRHG
ncbi:MAG: DUF933 domain-containing protein, partial [Patescibacteria group bacterium]